MARSVIHNHYINLWETLISQSMACKFSINKDGFIHALRFYLKCMPCRLEAFSRHLKFPNDKWLKSLIGTRNCEKMVIRSFTCFLPTYLSHLVANL